MVNRDQQWPHIWYFIQDGQLIVQGPDHEAATNIARQLASGQAKLANLGGKQVLLITNPQQQAKAATATDGQQQQQQQPAVQPQTTQPQQPQTTSQLPRYAVDKVLRICTFMDLQFCNSDIDTKHFLFRSKAFFYLEKVCLTKYFNGQKHFIDNWRLFSLSTEPSAQPPSNLLASPQPQQQQQQQQQQAESPNLPTSQVSEMNTG